MKKFILKLSIFLAIVLAGLVVLELGFVRKPTDFKDKYLGLEEHAPEVELLVLGHSHSNEGFDTRITKCRSYNMAMGFQNVYYDECILSQFIDRMDSLKYVVLASSYFHFYSMLPDLDRMGGENLFNTVKFHKYWHINEVNGKKIPGLSPKYNLEIFNNPPKAYAAMFKYYLSGQPWDRKAAEERNKFIEYGYRPKDVVVSESYLDEDGIRRARNHQPHYDNEPVFEFTPNYYIYDKIAKECKDRGVELYLVMFPVWHTYYDNLDEFQLSGTLRMLDSLSRNNDNCFVLNYMQDERFCTGDFQDGIHLNMYGAEKITGFIETDITE